MRSYNICVYADIWKIIRESIMLPHPVWSIEKG